MRQLIMNGHQITDYLRYQEFFAPLELLRQKELTAGFLYRQARFLSDLHRFHAEMFYGAVFNWKNCVGFEMSGWEDYYSAAAPVSQLTLIGEAALDIQTSDPAIRGLLADLWALASDTGLPTQDRDRLYCLLGAGFLLAGKYLTDFALTPKTVRDAYVGRREENYRSEDPFAGTGDILLEARTVPYRVTMKAGAGDRLADGETIRPRRILALPHAQGSLRHTVVIELADEVGCVTERIEIMPGDYRYCNMVGPMPVYFHPVKDEKNNARLERQGNVLTYTDETGKVYRRNCTGQKILGFALEDDDDGWILLEEERVDYHDYNGLFAESLPREGIVQIQFREGACLLLDKFGTVRSNFTGVSGSGYMCLDDFEMNGRGGTTNE